jgi:hypothetical protein
MPNTTSATAKQARPNVATLSIHESVLTPMRASHRVRDVSAIMR